MALATAVATVEGQWTQVGGDIDGEAAGDNSGWSVSLSADGTIVAVGAPENNGGGSDFGHTRVWRFDGTNWNQLGGDIDGEAVGDWSGWSVSVSADGTTVAVGAYLNDGTGTDAGHVRVFRLGGTTWTQLGLDIDGEAAGDNSGWSVSLSADGNVVAIGAPDNDGTGNPDAGHARVFRFDGTNWNQLGGDIDGEAAGDQSGWSVSLSADGNTVAVGAYRNGDTGTNAGHARVWRFDGTNWNQRGLDIDGEAADDQSGWSVSLSADGNTVAVGAYNNDGSTGTNAGHARVWRFGGTAWAQLGGDIDGEAAGDTSGKTVSLSADGNTLAVGANANDGAGSFAGHTRVWRFGGTAWTQLGGDIDGEAAYDQSGWSVSLSADGNTVAVGAIGNDGGTGTPFSSAGHVRVHSIPPAPTASPATSAPTASPTTSIPTASPTTSIPTASPSTSAPTASPTTTTPTASPTASPTTSTPTSSPTTSTPTVSPTTSPTTSSPTASPTVSPTESPSASPTTPCSTLTQTFTLTETATTCNPAPTPPVGGMGMSMGTSMGMAMGKAACPRGPKGAPFERSFEAAFETLWSANAVFSTVPFDTVKHDIETTAVWDADAGLWVQTVHIEYKPRSPISHVAVAAAGQQLIGPVPAGLPYCGCTPAVVVLAATTAYDIADVDEATSSSKMSSSITSSSKNGKCKGEYRASSSGKGKGKSARSAEQASTGSAAATPTVVAAAIAATVVAAAALVAVGRRIRQWSDDVGAPTLEVDSPQSHFYPERAAVIENPVCAF